MKRETILPSRPRAVHGRGPGPDRVGRRFLIPFLEHDDANRALMGQHAASGRACLRRRKPLVGTGIERAVAVDSAPPWWRCAWRSGRLRRRRRMVIRVNDTMKRAGEVGVDIYNLTKIHPFQPEHQHQPAPHGQGGRPCSPKGDVVADGASTDKGELALGQNMLIAFMPWNGYNFEDSILISERVVR